MKSYPSIPGPSNSPHSPCYAFVKYDGSNIRAEWSKKLGWYKFGTRNQLLDPSDAIFGRAKNLFLSKYSDDLKNVFNSDRLFKGVDNVVVFFEFFGSKTFAGMHHPDDPAWDVVLFDVNPLRKGMIGNMGKKSKKKKKNKRLKTFLPGTVVVFEPKNFNPEFWNSLSEEDKIKYYGPLGYGQEKKKLFIFLAPIFSGLEKHTNKHFDSGHCVLVDMDNGSIEIMRHTSDFRAATDEEF